MLRMRERIGRFSVSYPALIVRYMVPFLHVCVILNVLLVYTRICNRILKIQDEL